MTQPTPPPIGRWWDDPQQSSKWRFTTYRLRAMFDGHPHLLRPGVDYPDWAAVEDVTRKLSNAAYYRKTVLHVTVSPSEGMWVQSEQNLTGIKEVPLMRQHELALARIQELEEELSVLKMKK